MSTSKNVKLRIMKDMEFLEGFPNVAAGFLELFVKTTALVPISRTDRAVWFM